MEFEEIGEIWRDQATGSLRRTRTSDLSMTLGQAATYNSGVRRGLRRSAMIAAVPLIFVFGYLAIRAPNAFALSGAIVLTGFAIGVAVWYWAISRTRTDPSLPVREAVEAELSRLRVLEEFGRRAAWGRAVLYSGTLLLVIGQAVETDSVEVRAAYLGAFIFGFALIELVIRGRRARRPSYTRAMREDLESWLHGVEDFDLEGGEIRSEGGAEEERP